MVVPHAALTELLEDFVMGYSFADHDTIMNLFNIYYSGQSTINSLYNLFVRCAQQAPGSRNKHNLKAVAGFRSTFNPVSPSDLAMMPVPQLSLQTLTQLRIMSRMRSTVADDQLKTFVIPELLNILINTNLVDSLNAFSLS